LETAARKTFSYTYDFGDDWEHTVKVLKLFEAPIGTPLPALINAKGACPPEDVGGPYGYMDFCEAIADVNHERHAEIVEWHGEEWDLHDAGTDARSKALQALSRKWSAKPAARKTPVRKSANG
jgi:hypothetical protein